MRSYGKEELLLICRNGACRPELPAIQYKNTAQLVVHLFWLPELPSHSIRNKMSSSLPNCLIKFSNAGDRVVPLDEFDAIVGWRWCELILKENAGTCELV